MPVARAIQTPTTERQKPEQKQLSVAVKPGSKVKARSNIAAPKPLQGARAAASGRPLSVVHRPRSSESDSTGVIASPVFASDSGLPVALDHGRLIDEDPLPLGAAPAEPARESPEFQEIPRRDPVLPLRSRPGRDADEPVPAFDGNVDGPSIGAPARKPGELSEQTDYVDVLPKNWVRQSGRGAIEIEDDD